METLKIGDQQHTVREVGRPDGKRLCRHLTSVDGDKHFLEYVISVGPYKFDVSIVHALTEAEVAAFSSGTLHLGQLAEQLGDADERSRKYERPR